MKYIFFLTSLILIATNLYSDNLKNADDEYLKGNYKAANKYWMTEAKKGNLEAIHKIGLAYHNGKGVSKNYKEALKWYRKAADSRYAKSEYNIGVMYYNGEGVSKNYKEALKWYTKAANQGDEYAQFNLGVMYARGEGAVKNYLEAMKLFKKSANKNFANAQHSLGIMYEKGEGVSPNIKEAVKWYKTAAEQGHTEAQYMIALYYELGNGVKQDLNKSLKWYQKAAEQGHTEAQNTLNDRQWIKEKINQKQKDDEKLAEILKEKNKDKIASKITEYCTIEASEFTSESLKKRVFVSCNKKTLNENLSLRDIEEKIKNTNNVKIERNKRKKKIQIAEEKRKEKKLLKEKNRELLKNTGVWKIAYFVDEFGEYTKDSYITTELYIKGLFSNSATENSKLNVRFIISNSKSVALELYEYAGKNPVKTYGTDEYTVLVQDKFGNRFNLKATNYSSRLRFSEKESLKIHNIFLSGGSVKFRITENKYYLGKYNFELNTDFYNNVYLNL